MRYDDTKFYQCFENKNFEHYLDIIKLANSLGSVDRSIFYLTFKWGFELFEISEILGIDVNALNNRSKKIVKFLHCKIQNKPVLHLVS